MFRVLDRISDGMLVSRTLQGDRKAFGRLYDRYIDQTGNFLKYLFPVFSQQEILDVTSQTFIECLSSIHRFEGKSTFRTWLFSIARNCGRALLRDGYRTRTVSVTGAGVSDEDGSPGPQREFADQSPDPAAQLTEKRERLLLWKAVSRLPDNLREVTIYRYIQQLSTKETATMMQCSTDNVKTMLSRALKELRKQLSDGGGTE